CELLINSLDASEARSQRRRKLNRLAFKIDFPSIRNQRAGQRLDEGRFAGAVVADNGKNFFPREIEVRFLHRHDMAISLRQSARLHGKIGVAGEDLGHARWPRPRYWSAPTASITSTPVAIS